MRFTTFNIRISPTIYISYTLTTTTLHQNNEWIMDIYMSITFVHTTLIQNWFPTI
jgi:hypothetical protein